MEPADLIAIVLVLAALIGCINHLWIRLPPAIGVLVGSLVLSLLIVASDKIFHLHAMSWFRGTLDAANLPHLFLDGALALLLFAGSLHVDVAELSARRWMILLLATASVILSMLVFGTGMWLVFALVGSAVPLIWCFVLGAILAPTDAVIVASLLRRVRLPPSLRAAIVGESLFNDGAGVVLFLIALRVTQGEAVSIGHGQIVTALVREIAGGAALGFAAGFLAARLIRAIKDDGLQLLISLALALGCYRLANLSELSGPIAVVTAGLCMRSLSPGVASGTPASGTGNSSALIGFWTLLDQLLTTMLFLLIGFQILDLKMQPIQLLLVMFAVPLAVAARMVSVAIPTAIVDWGLTRDGLRDKARDAAVLTWAGLRGGISVALALTLPASPWRADLLVVCYAVVIFTIVVQGLTMPPFLRAVYGTTPPE
jgi:CPA1 family monovalent cation:H+ antiporter